MTPITPRVFNPIHPSLNVEVSPPPQAPIAPTSEPKPSSPSKLAQANAQALEVWQSFLAESAEKEAASAHHWVDRAVDKVQGWFAARSPKEVRAERAKQEQALFAAVKERVESGKSATIFEAMEHLAQDAEPAVKERAQFYLNSQGPKTFSKLLIGGLLELSKYSSPDPHKTLQFLDEVFKVLESQGACHKTALGVYQLVDAISSHEDVLVETQRHLAAFQGNAGLLRSIQKEAYGINPLNVAVEIGLIGISGGVANLAKAAYKLRYAPALWNSPKVLAGGFAVHSIMMGGSLGTLHVAKAAVTEDIQSLSARKIGKIYLKDGLMVPVTHLFGATGKLLFPESVLAQHGMGLAGMSTSTQLYLTLMPEDAPIGGITESIAADMVGYGTFTAGGKVAHRLSEGVNLPDLNGPAFKNLHVQMATLLMGGIPVAGRGSEAGEVQFTPEVKEINGVEFARIPAGEFEMGSKAQFHSLSVRTVYISEFWMMKKLVTNAEFDAYVKANEAQPYGLLWRNPRTGREEVLARLDSEWFRHQPSYVLVEETNAEEGTVIVDEGTELMLFAQYGELDALVEKDKQGNPTYSPLSLQMRVVRLVPKARDISLTNFANPDQPAVSVSWYEALGYAAWKGMWLPTEAQWEKAAKGPYGTLEEELDKDVRQWTMDWYQNGYRELSNRDPQGPVNGEGKILRGRSWHCTSPLVYILDADRGRSKPDSRLVYGGFRCVACPQD